MEPTNHTINDLFIQLGLPSEDADIEDFIRTHSHMAGYISLAEAPFWTPAQAAFLREETLKDADWVEVIDQLNTRLHKT
jgi:hypothetical protein